MSVVEKVLFQIVVVLVVILALGKVVQANSNANWVACKQPNKLGLYEQCEEVELLQILGQRIRAYSIPRKEVLNLRPTNIFLAKRFQSSEKITKDQEVLIPAAWLWNNSQPGFQTLCKVKKATSLRHVTVQCGSNFDQEINRTAIWKLNLIEYKGTTLPEVAPIKIRQPRAALNR